MRLALSYAPARAQPGLAALMALDARLGGLLRQSSDAMVAQLRLTWWHDALSRLDDAPPPAEPILAALAADVLPHGVTGADLAGMIDGWETLLDESAPDAEALALFAAARGGTLFAAAAAVLGAGPDPAIERAGQGWALVDLARHHRDPAVARAALVEARARFDGVRRRRWPRDQRALGALAVLAAADAGETQLPLPPVGSPRRVARMLWHRLSGR